MQSAAQPILQLGTHPVLFQKNHCGQVASSAASSRHFCFSTRSSICRGRRPSSRPSRGSLSFNLAVELGIIELVCIVLYVVPRTSILGAILLTGYLGGAMATATAQRNSLFGETLFPVYVGVIAWGGIYLRDDRLRALVPWRR